MRYAYRDIEALLAKVAKIAEGTSDADMIQDLNDASKLCKENPEPLKKVGFDMLKLDIAAEMSAEMGQLRGAATADRASDNEKKIIRDKAYTHLKEAVDAIRACGQYVFWKNDARRKGYSSEYARRLRKNAARSSDAEKTLDSTLAADTAANE